MQANNVGGNELLHIACKMLRNLSLQLTFCTGTGYGAGRFSLLKFMCRYALNEALEEAFLTVDLCGKFCQPALCPLSWLGGLQHPHAHLRFINYCCLIFPVLTCGSVPVPRGTAPILPERPWLPGSITQYICTQEYHKIGDVNGTCERRPGGLDLVWSLTSDIRVCAPSKKTSSF